MYEVELVAEHPVDDLADLAATAERVGFEGVWVTDHYNNRNPLVALAAIAERTEDVPIGPGVTNPYYAHPAWMASAMATLDELSGGRARLGVGPGDERTLNALAIERESPLYDVLDAVRLTRTLLAGDRADVDGLAREAALNYDAEAIPIYVGAQGPNMLRMAADHGDGILINGSHPADFAWSLDQIGETDAEIVAYTSFSVAEDAAAAAEAARQPVAFVAAGSPPQVLDRHGLDHELAEAIGDSIEVGAFGEAFEMVSDAMLDAFAIHGTPGDCADRVAALEGAGVDTVVVGSPLGPEPATAIELAAHALDI